MSRGATLGSQIAQQRWGAKDRAQHREIARDIAEGVTTAANRSNGRQYTQVTAFWSALPALYVQTVLIVCFIRLLLSIEFMFERPDLGSNFFDHF
jgi:hypothetical protein